MGTRLLIVHPGADFSTLDVFTGLTEALARAGHDVGAYNLSTRLDITARYLYHTLALARRNDPSLPKRPHFTDVTLKASEDVVLAALRGRVDAVLVISAMYLHPNALLMLRAARVPVGIVFTESPYQDEEQADYAALASVCWTQERTSVDVLRQRNARTYYLPAAYRAGFHAPGAPDPTVPAHDVLFIGSLFKERAELLAAVDWTGINLGIYGNVEALDRRSRLYRRLAPHIRGGVMSNALAVAYYRRAKIVLNPYRTSVWFDGEEHVDTGESLNPRAYELAAVGTLQLSSWRAEIPTALGGGCLVYHDAANLEAWIRDFLKPDAESYRQRLVSAAYRRVQGQTFDARAAQITEQLGHALLHNPFIAPLASAAAD